MFKSENLRLLVNNHRHRVRARVIKGTSAVVCEEAPGSEPVLPGAQAHSDGTDRNQVPDRPTARDVAPSETEAHHAGNGQSQLISCLVSYALP